MGCMRRCIMVLVYICSFPYPAYRVREDHKQKLCTFPPTEWFQERLHMGGISADAQSSKTKKLVRPLTLRAVCDIEPGEYNKGILTPWSKEEEIQLQYYITP